MNFLILIVFLFFTKLAHAEEPKIPESFRVNGEYINPQCVEQLNPWISESNSIIVQSVVLETCQNSNLAFKGKETLYQKKNTVGYHGDIDDPHDGFSYTYQMALQDNKHILSHGSTLSLYVINNKRLAFDVSKNDFKNVNILSKIAEIGFFHCFENARVIENELIINKRIYYPENSRATACDDSKTEQIKIDLSGID